MKIRIATRQSPLALWQAEHIKNQLLHLHPELIVELIPMLTTADKLLDISLTKIGGKGLFVKELENALLENRADIAVHSIKDLPAELPASLILEVICQREDARDCLVADRFTSLESLPSGAVVGTSSLRRQCQLLALRSDLHVKNLRGNVDTRLKKLTDHQFDAIILAAAGLLRLNKENVISEYFPANQWLPAIGQGAIGIECREDDHETRECIAPLDDLETRICVSTERAMNQKFGGNCQTPIAAHAVIKNNHLQMMGLIGKPDGSLILRSSMQGAIHDYLDIGLAVADDLFSQGAGHILSDLC